MAEDTKEPDTPGAGGSNLSLEEDHIGNHSESANASETPVDPKGGSNIEGTNGSTRKGEYPLQEPFEVNASVAVNTRRLQQLLRDSARQDCVLASIEYLAHALHYMAFSPHWIKLRNTLTSLRYWREVGNARTASKRITHDSEQHSALLNLSALFSNARYTLRLFGLFNIWTEMPSIFHHPARDHLIHGINITQIFTITAYQLLENIGHLASNKILSHKVIGSKTKVEKFYIWGARALFLHFMLELMKLAREARLMRKSATLRSKHTEAVSAELNEDALGQGWGKRLWASSIWGLLCLYWSCGQTIPLVEETSGGLSFLADFFMLQDNWALTRK